MLSGAALGVLWNALGRLGRSLGCVEASLLVGTWGLPGGPWEISGVRGIPWGHLGTTGNIRGRPRDPPLSLKGRAGDPRRPWRPPGFPLDPN